MNIILKEEENCTLLTITDIRIDSSISEEYKNKLVSCLKNKPIIVDFKKLEFIDSSGLSAFIYFYKQGKAKNITIRFINISDKVMSILKMTGLTKIFEIYDNLDEALVNLS
ncbi:STAS domain-containing protein [Deferribacterales bacterium Es71-Z0220]|jgi:anti-anti-sigma factor|uniref:STAS domain-containing protein n=1 Tax=Deferrivibrio essentukiensis TaxID=2880922 RepID=UPI001F611160|nr:STAS domain-containing protein [Deferrivibrio essentukiensis]MBZ4672801.1 anti-anti-sigma factor [Deferribacteraceae bacterium]MCB4205508.1 STAS domain-containing protein [Deferrivibrio essentukiensis]